MYLGPVSVNAGSSAPWVRIFLYEILALVLLGMSHVFPERSRGVNTGTDA